MAAPPPTALGLTLTQQDDPWSLSQVSLSGDSKLKLWLMCMAVPGALMAVFHLRTIDYAEFFVSEPVLKPCVNSLIIQTILFASLVFALSVIFQKTELVSNESTARGALSAGIFFVIVWFMVGIMTLKKAAKQIQMWDEIERIALDVDSLKVKKQQYEKLFYNINTYGYDKIPESLIRELEHLMMRLQFVNPIYLPMLTESFLRKDFDFARYLAKVHAKTLDRFFFLHWFSMQLTLPLLALCMLSFGNIELIHNFFVGNSQISNQVVVLMLQASLSLFFATGLWLLQANFESISHKLFPQILLDKVDSRNTLKGGYKEDLDESAMQSALRQPEAFNLIKKQTVSDPFSSYGDLPIPDYLDFAGSDIY